MYAYVCVCACVRVCVGLENAERNVLPTLNNLLENREMSLDDGRFLMPKPANWEAKPDNSDTKNLVFVHEGFRVIGLSVPVPSYSGRALDPPLRSRFQCRFIDEYPSDYLVLILLVYHMKMFYHLYNFMNHYVTYVMSRFKMILHLPICLYSLKKHLIKV